MAKKSNIVNDTAENAGIGKPAPVNQKVNRPKGKLLQSAAPFWNFENEPVFTGTPLGTFVKDPKDDRIIGYDFVDDNGEAWVIGAANAIEKSLHLPIEIEEGVNVEVMKAERRLYIKWCGKIELKDSGKTFNKYEIILLD
jgi:hypothetical protein